MIPNATAPRSAGSGSGSGWHKKAKWMIKNVLLKTPSDGIQLRALVQRAVTGRHGVDSNSAAVIGTALLLWNDTNLVNAIQSNPTFLRAKERIQNLSGHILPLVASSSPPNSHQVDLSSTNSNNQLAPPFSSSQAHHSHQLPPSLLAHQTTPSNVVDATIQQFITCPSCGTSVHPTHDEGVTLPFLSSSPPSASFLAHPDNHTLSNNQPPSTLAHSSSPPLGYQQERSGLQTTEDETEVNELSFPIVRSDNHGGLSYFDIELESDDSKFTPGSVGKTPYDSQATGTTGTGKNDSGGSGSVSDWFGPLVLASVAVVGLAIGVFSGEIMLPRMQSVVSRTVAAVSMMVQASNSLFKLLG